MRTRTITSKITLWYTLFMIVIVGGFFVILFVAGNNQAGTAAKTKIMDSVADASEEIEKEGSRFIIDDDLVFYDNGVYISVYDSDGELIEGRIPAQTRDLPELKDKNSVKLKAENNENWYLYDSAFVVEGDVIWVRGIAEEFVQTGFMTYMTRFASIAFPILVLIGTFGGYALTRRSMKPIWKVIKTAEEIEQDADLSRRIEIGEKDSGEIYELSTTYNDMFDKLEAVFIEEKQFTSNVSHELRTPLAVIISQSDYAMEDVEYREKALGTINREARRMSRLVNQLLTLARSDAGRLAPKKERVNLSMLVEDIAEQQSFVAEERGVSIKSEIEPEVIVCGDESMLMRSVLNLVANAIKYGVRERLLGEGDVPNEGSIGTETIGEVKISVKREGDKAICVVEDRGKGIASEHIDRIWERFYRVDSSRTDEGYGLGLPMVKSMVELHGGAVKAESEIGEGSKFTVTLPICEL